MSVNEILRRDAFDDIITSLENLLSQVQALVNSLDPLNDAQVIADVQSVADNIAQVIAVESNLSDINTLAGLSTQLTALGAITADITTNAENIADIQNAFQNAQDAIEARTDAIAARDKAEEWASKPEDEPVETSPDRFSALHYAAKASELYDLIAGLSDFAGKWSELSSSLDKGNVVYHEGEFWFLLVDLADVTTSEPDSENADWKLLTATILRRALQGVAEYYNESHWTVGTGETTIDIGFDGNIIVGLNESWLFDGGWSQDGNDLIIDQELQSGDAVAVVKMTSEISLSQIIEMDIDDPQPGDLQQYDGDKWVNVLPEQIVLNRKVLKHYDPFLHSNGGLGGLDLQIGGTWEYVDIEGSSRPFNVNNGFVSAAGSGSFTEMEAGAVHDVTGLSNHIEILSAPVVRNVVFGAIISLVDNENLFGIQFNLNTIELHEFIDGSRTTIESIPIDRPFHTSPQKTNISVAADQNNRIPISVSMYGFSEVFFIDDTAIGDRFLAGTKIGLGGSRSGAGIYNYKVERR